MQITTQQALARAIEVRRVRLGITKAELAKRSGLSAPSLSKRLSSLIAIDADEIEALAGGLEIDPFDLMAMAAVERSQAAAAAA